MIKLRSKFFPGYCQVNQILHEISYNNHFGKQDQIKIVKSRILIWRWPGPGIKNDNEKDGPTGVKSGSQVAKHNSV